MRISSSWNRLIGVTACAASTAFAGTVYAQVPDQPGWDLVWNDEFNGTSVDTARS